MNVYDYEPQLIETALHRRRQRSLRDPEDIIEASMLAQVGADYFVVLAIDEGLRDVFRIVPRGDGVELVYDTEKSVAAPAAEPAAAPAVENATDTTQKPPVAKKRGAA